MTLESRLYEHFDNSLQLLNDKPARLTLAFSGGLDSSVLMHILKHYDREFGILAWHVNHGLVDNASDMEAFCRYKAAQYQFDIKVSHLQLDKLKSNIEAAAREARYGLFREALSDQDCLLTAHHANDLAETYFLNLLRGSGSAGLRGIARLKYLSKIPVLRPLLDCGRDELEQFARTNKLNWIEDPSNRLERFNRNYLRSKVIPVIRKRWPGYLGAVASACDLQREAQTLLDDLAAQDYLGCRQEIGFHAVSLKRDRIDLLSTTRQKNLIRFWLRENAREGLSQKKLSELVRQLSVSRESCPVISSETYCIRVYRGDLFIVPRSEVVTIQSEFELENDSDLELKAINLKVNKQMLFDYFKLEDKGQAVAIKFRSNHPTKTTDRHRLKHLFQNHHVPPWLRAQTPLVYVDGELIGLWLNA